MVTNFLINLGDEEQLNLLRNVVYQMSEGMIVTNNELDEPGPKMILVNPAMCKISGYSEEELIGKTPRIFHGYKTDKETAYQMKNKLRNGESVKYETVNYKKSGEEYLIELNVSPVFNSLGKIINYVSIQRDISLEKVLKKQIEGYARLLDRITNEARIRSQQISECVA